MNKITKAVTAGVVGVALALGGSVAANAAESYIDFGTPFYTHGGLGNSHIRGGDWAITSKATVSVGNFATYGAPASVVAARDAKPGYVIERLRLTFTPDAGFTLADLQAEFDSEVASGDLAVGSGWIGGGYIVGHAQVLNGKAVVHVFKVVKG